MTNGVTVLSYSSLPAKHIVETNSSSDEVYLIKVNKLTEALSLEKDGCCLSQAELSPIVHENFNNTETYGGKSSNGGKQHGI